ncbi:Alpha/Beta hydrolase protein [Mycena amicta]|nr:Alpha/Beta hydrolase protein [Mycena amicta]
MSLSASPRRRKPALTEEQKCMYSQEKVINFRFISKIVARHAPETLGADHIAPLELQEYLSEIGQFAELAYNVISVATVFAHLRILLEPGLPFEGYNAILTARLVSSFTGTTARLPGFVAYRANTRQLILAISGTNVDSAVQALYDVHALRHRHPSKRGKVHTGFWRLYKGIRDPALAALREGLKQFEGEIAEVVVTGHSMGAAVSQLFVLDVLRGLLPLGDIPLRVVGFGGPRVGTEGLRYGEDAFSEYAVKRHNDGGFSSSVPALPPKAFGYRHFVERPYYHEHGRLYRVPADLKEYSLFHCDAAPSSSLSSTSSLFSPSASSTDSEPTPLHPRGGHNYYNGRDMEKVARMIRWYWVKVEKHRLKR